MQAILVFAKLLFGLDIDDVGCDELARGFDLIDGQMLQVAVVGNLNSVRGVDFEVGNQRQILQVKELRLGDTRELFTA